MDRWNALLGDTELLAYFREMDELEADRQYCCHGLPHALDVARIGYLMILERGLAIPKELFYVTALLHDLGRIRQYKEGVSHHEAGVELAEHFLCKHGFAKEEQAMIIGAIASHRQEIHAVSYPLAEVLYDADKRSRTCFFCQAADTCYWEQEKRNHTLAW